MDTTDRQHDPNALLVTQKPDGTGKTARASSPSLAALEHPWCAPTSYRGGSLYQFTHAALRRLSAKANRGFVQMRVRHKGQRSNLQGEGLT